jgi:enoyl-CoA hydratase/carnithine racemase
VKSTSEDLQISLTRDSPAYCRVVFDNPPLNLMGPDSVAQFEKLMTELEGDEHVKVVGRLGA